MKKRIVSLLLALVLVLGMLPSSAFAGGWYTLYAFDEDGVWYQVSSMGKGTKVANQGNGWEWDPVTKTLTLHNASFISPSGGIEICAGATVRMADGSKNIVSARSAGGFAGRGDLTFIGNASLEALSSSGDNYSGFVSAKGKCTIESSTIIANAGFSCSGLDLTDGSISCNSFSTGSKYRGNSTNITNSTVSVEGYSFNSYGEAQYRGGFYAGIMKVKDSAIIAKNLGDGIGIGDLNAIDSSIALDINPAIITPAVLQKHFIYTKNQETGGFSVSFGPKTWIEMDELELNHSTFSSNLHIRCKKMPSLKGTQGGNIFDLHSIYLVYPNVAKDYPQYIQNVMEGTAAFEGVSITPIDPSPTPTPDPDPNPLDPDPIPAETTFPDVPQSAYYYEAVKWAVKNRIVAGYSDGRFKPNNVCNRAEAMMMFYRAAGSPDIQLDNGNFTDVGKDHWANTAICWAVQHGITSGTSSNTFSPNNKLTRAQAMTFLYRLAGSPQISGDNPFKDVNYNAYYYYPVMWAVDAGITSGTSKTHFSPNSNCTRAQIVTFLYRYLVESTNAEKIPISCEYNGDTIFTVFVPAYWENTYRVLQQSSPDGTMFGIRFVDKENYDAGFGGHIISFYVYSDNSYLTGLHAGGSVIGEINIRGKKHTIVRRVPTDVQFDMDSTSRTNSYKKKQKDVKSITDSITYSNI